MGVDTVEKGKNLRKIGIFGGAFDPVHTGHVLSCQDVREKFSLELLLVIPSYLSPHKIPAQYASYKHRLYMTELAFAQIPHIQVSDMAAKRSGYTYSVDLMHEVHKLYPEAELFSIIGMDSYIEMPTWKDPEELFSLSHWIVMTRPGYQMKGLETVFPPKLSCEFEYQESLSYRHASGKKLLFQETEFMDISSTAIRDKLSRGEEVSPGELPPAVFSYIRSHKLYEKPSVADADRRKEVDAKNVSR
ncbi:MAG: nicotinate (nicotinamide) nucleotide adenylyltransferase [Deltaproteobacteria bacterium]|nr:nicotinate (nicotinamide) nucleotide adenylyltransferase [Deltaproteobacteria bacterium]